MVVKTITITKEAYDSLARVKRTHESFSQLFLKLAPKKSRSKILQAFFVTILNTDKLGINAYKTYAQNLTWD